MIAQLTGVVARVGADQCVIDVKGVGYLVHASTRTLSALPVPPEHVCLQIETIVREDAIILYGFVDTAEREWFRLLTTVQGVGGRVALAILSTLAPPDLIAAIATADKASLSRAAGVGGKLALRVISELQHKVGSMPVAGGSSAFGVAGAGHTVEGDALLALEGLGFRRLETQPVVRRIVEDMGPEGAPLDEVIRRSLKELAR